MLCQICHTQEASVYLIESVENTRTTLHICENCAQKRHVGEVLNKSALALQQLLASLSSSVDASLDQKIPEIECPYCGLTYAQVRQTGRLGCEQCYDVFREQLLPLLRQFHQADEHRGRSGMTPDKATESAEIRELREKIQRAVAEENYELAAGLRDALKRLLGKAGA
jgi:protein arginine kinase activator